MRVLFVTGEYPPMQGGVGDYTWALGTALTQQGVDVHVLTSKRAGPAYLTPHGVANVYPDIANWGWSLAARVRRLASEIEADILHIQYQSAAYDLHPAINLLPCSLRGKAWPGRLAVTFHDLRVPYLFPKAGPLRWQANLTMAANCDAVVATNQEDYLRLQQYDRLSGKLAHVPIGANIQPEPPAAFERDAQRSKWHVSQDDLLLCYFGFLNASKGGVELVGAAARLASEGIPVHLLMVGGQVGASDPANYAYLEQVKSLIAELSLDDRVHWTGFTAAAEVSANLLAADIAVLPYRDGASFRRGSLMAALAHGLAIISTEPVVAVPEMEHGKNIWLVPRGASQELAEAIRHLWSDSQLRRRLSEGAQELASHFTWDAIANRHIEIYRELI